jgi:hypothetical protein
VVVHHRRSHLEPEDRDLRAENHLATTIPGVSMGFAGCPSGAGGGVREWEEEEQAVAALGLPVPPEEGDTRAVQLDLIVPTCACFSVL